MGAHSLVLVAVQLTTATRLLCGMFRGIWRKDVYFLLLLRCNDCETSALLGDMGLDTYQKEQ